MIFEIHVIKINGLIRNHPEGFDQILSVASRHL
jgi:hypothetical protein